MNALLTPVSSPSGTNAHFPSALMPLFKPKRYKVSHGGRGRGGSWGFARALLILNLERPERTLCAREFQKSIQDSVHRLLSDQITALKMNYLYDVQQAKIIGRGACAGAEFGFEGIRANTDQIKSYEGVKRCWVEEAHKTSKASWADLIPTIRREGSEIWATFNDRLEEDDTYQRFVVHPPGALEWVAEDGRCCAGGTTPLLDASGAPTGGTLLETSLAYIVFHSWRDNPWFPAVLRAEMEELRARDYDEYLHVWEGHLKKNLEGAVYADELREAQAQSRIRDVPYDRTLPVDVFFDIGRRHYTAMWFEQRASWEHRFIDFYKNRMKDLPHYLQVLQGRGYTYGTLWMPHDAFAKRMGMKLGMSIAEQARAAGFHVREVPRLTIENGISAVRTIFPNAYFDRERCAEGLRDLKNYSYYVDSRTKQVSSTPDQESDEADTADALRYAGVCAKAKRRGVRGAVMEVMGRLLPEREVGERGMPRGYGASGADASTGWMR